MIKRIILVLLVLATAGVSTYLLFSSFQQLRNTYQESTQSILLQRKKLQLLTAMYNAARERSLILSNMLSETDDFALDDLNQALAEQAQAFIMARQQLTNLPLSHHEQDSLEKQRLLTMETAPLQNQVANLLINGEHDKAKSLLFEKALPEQIQILEQLNRTSGHVQIKIDQAIRNLSEKLQESGKHFEMLVFILTGSSLLLVFMVLTFSSQREKKQLSRIIQEREQHLHESEIAKEILSQEHERTRITLQSIGDGVITTFADGRIEYLNPVAEQLTGWLTREAEGKMLPTVFSISSEITGEPLANPVEQVLQQNTTIDLSSHSLLTHRDGSHISIDCSAAPINNHNGEITGVVLVFHDTSDERSLLKQIKYQASHDTLTGVWNRDAFENKLEELQEDCYGSDTCHALLYIDLDQFKVVNDTAGHAAGDELLKQITTEFSHTIRGSDMLARIGGDEFAVLLRNCDSSHAIKVAESIRHMTHNFKFVWDGQNYPIGTSIGIAMITNMTQLSDVLSQADQACYKVKRHGRNAVHLYSSSDEELSDRYSEMHWVSRIQEALENRQFVLYSQKIEALGTDDSKIDYYEILLRLRAPDGKIIPPSAFIPAAERFDLMSKIDEFVVESAINWLTEQQAGSVKIAINLSAQSLCKPDFLHHIVHKVKASSKVAKFLIFEITETSAISNLRAAIDFMNQLIELGIQFSLDDFGSGLSSFAYLKNLPVSFIKIDGAFVRDMATDSVDAAMVQAIAQVGHKLDMKTVAEFVENRETLDLLNQYGISYAQGYYIDTPQPLSSR